MIFDKQGTTTVVTQESVSISTFLLRLNESYQKLKNDNLILNMLSLSQVSAEKLLDLLPMSTGHKKKGKSFVIVSDTVNYNEVHEDLMVVPTLQEAFDMIEMDEIERDLDF